MHTLPKTSWCIFVMNMYHMCHNCEVLSIFCLIKGNSLDASIFSLGWCSAIVKSHQSTNARERASPSILSHAIKLGHRYRKNVIKETTGYQALSLSRRFVNTLRPRRSRRHFADDGFRYIFLNENIWITIKISLKFIVMGPINDIAALVQIMAWRRPGDKPLFEAMMDRLLTHICVARPQWVNWLWHGRYEGGSD